MRTHTGRPAKRTICRRTCRMAGDLPTIPRAFSTSWVDESLRRRGPRPGSILSPSPGNGRSSTGRSGGLSVELRKEVLLESIGLRLRGIREVRSPSGDCMKGLPDVEPFPDGRMGDGVERFLSAVIPVDRSRTRDSLKFGHEVGHRRPTERLLVREGRPRSEPSKNRRRPPGRLWLSSVSLSVPLSELVSEPELGDTGPVARKG